MGVDKFIERSTFSIKIQQKFSIDNTVKQCKDHLMLGLFLIFLTIIFSYGVGNVSAASGDIIYVNTHGNDSWNGQSSLWDGVNGPKLSIKNATGIVNKRGTVNIANGRYSGAKNTKIIIYKDMIIKGQSKTSTIINGTGYNWIFQIKPGINVAISNLTMINGTSAKGGGAITNYGTLTLKSSYFISNTAYGGGALINYINGNLTVKDCTFTSNKATFGGAIENAGKMNVTGGEFRGNRAIDGGAIDNADTLTVTKSKFTDNHATEDGGAISNYEGDLYLHFNKIVRNNAPHGGAVIFGKGAADLSLNWWGSNAGPLNMVIGKIKVSPWLVLNINNSGIINNNGTYNITADLLHDSNLAYHDPANGHIPDGIQIKFNSTLGTINSPVYTVYGVSQAFLSVGILSGIADISVTLDNQTVHKSVNIDPAPTVIKTDLVNYGEGLPVKFIKIKFSESIKKGDMSIDFENSHGKKLLTTKSINGNVLTITPVSPLTPGRYILTLNTGCLTDLAGNLIKAYSTNFTVEGTNSGVSHARTSWWKIKFRHFKSHEKLEKLENSCNWSGIHDQNFFKNFILNKL